MARNKSARGLGRSRENVYTFERKRTYERENMNVREGEGKGGT